MERVSRYLFGRRLLLLLPGTLAIGLFILLPTALVLLVSLQEMHTFDPARHWAGFDNYWGLLRTASFWHSVLITLGYAISSVILQLGVGLAGALALARQRRGVGFILAASVLPYVLPTVLVSVVWRWMLDPSYGIVNTWGARLGCLPHDFNWFGKGMVLTTVVLVSVWQFFPFVMLLCYARLITIPKVRYEAAAVDGLSPARQFWRVTLPELRPVLASIVLLRTLWMFTKFDTVWLLAGREAVGEYVRTLPVLSYMMTFDNLQAGIGAAVAMLLVLFLLLTLALYWACGRRWGHV